MPATSELAEFKATLPPKEYDNKLRAVKALIDKTAYEDICKEIEAPVQDWAKSQTLLDIDHVSIEFSKDDLLMNELKNNKAYNNFSLKVGIHYDISKVIGKEEDFYEQVYAQTFDALRTSPYAMFKIGSINTAGYSLDNISRFESNAFHFATEKVMVPDQSKEELNIQTIAYNYVLDFEENAFGEKRADPRRRATLKRFGIDPATSELIIHIPINVPYYDDTLAFNAALEGRSAELQSLILKDTSAAKYLKDNKATSIKISFEVPFEQTSDFTYTYKLN